MVVKGNTGERLYIQHIIDHKESMNSRLFLSRNKELSPDVTWRLAFFFQNSLTHISLSVLTKNPIYIVQSLPFHHLNRNV